MPPIRTLLLLLVIAPGCTIACTSFVEPRSVHVDSSTYDESRLIPYRTLVRADFKAPCAPAAFAGNDVDVVTAALVRTGCCSISTRAAADSSYIEALVENLHFEARMSQNHSWWNPHRLVTAQALEHEQVHFALAELAARRANARIVEIGARIRARASSEPAAVRAARVHLQREVDRVQEDLAAAHAEFDRDTANGRRLDRNHAWYENVRDELERTAPRNPRALASLHREDF
ncbi:MAG TPA: hypothetical protein VF247_05270 [Candidatus Krumholzibacteria bacterium]